MRADSTAHPRRASRAAIIVCLLALLVPAVGARAEVTWEVTGRGWGHGIGLSQWGAFGYAKHGKGWKGILRHYYRHTKLGHVDGGTVGVLLRSGENSVDFTDAARACGADLDEQR